MESMGIAPFQGAMDWANTQAKEAEENNRTWCEATKKTEKPKPRSVESFEFEQEVGDSSVNDFSSQNLNTLT